MCCTHTHQMFYNIEKYKIITYNYSHVIAYVLHIVALFSKLGNINVPLHLLFVFKTEYHRLSLATLELSM